MLLRLGPFGGDDGVADGVARGEVSRHAVGAENAFALAAEAFHGGLGAGVARVSMKADAEGIPGLEGMGEHKELGFGIGSGADGGAGEPGVADFAGIRVGIAVAGVSGRPEPTLDVPVARGTDDGVVALADDNERDGGAFVTPLKSGIDVLRGGFETLRDDGPAVEVVVQNGSTSGRCRGERFGMVPGEGFETDEGSGEGKVRVFHAIRVTGKTERGKWEGHIWHSTDFAW